MYRVKFSKAHSIIINGKDNELQSCPIATRKRVIAISKMLKKRNVPEKDYKFIISKTGQEVTL